ncbi:hypothetical protein G7046_g7271 [Stylonectria norvegica]|nr:hypothetical protein G7046_g7271 [Stylonectria norvegica]
MSIPSSIANNGIPSPNLQPRRCLGCAQKLEVQQRPVVAPSDNEVLVEIVATGICGSDCHNWESDKVSRQLVLGHESSGVIVRVGKNVTSRTVGQRVAVEPGFACMECEFCIRGNTNTCENLKYCGLDPTDGTLCQYFTCPWGMTVPIPDTISWEEAGAIQPLAIAVQLARRAALNAQQTMAIFGCGPLGLLILAVAKAYGVKKIVVFDIEESRTQFAQSYGADVAIVTPKNTDPSKDSLTFSQEYAKEIIAKHDIGSGFDIAVEASGAEICAQMALCMLKSGGTCKSEESPDIHPAGRLPRIAGIQAGLGKQLTSVPLFLVTAKDLIIKGTVRYTPGCFADAISLLSRKKVDLKPLITSVYPLTAAAEAFKAQHARKDIKIIAYGTGTLWFTGVVDEINRQTIDGIKVAIEAGYRHLDGAQMYRTETSLGAAMLESKVPRSDFFLTTKALTINDIEGALENSLVKLGTSYVDLYMIHHPFEAKTPAELQNAWRGMERCVERGLARNIGVSNFTIQHMSTILETATIKPAVNQIEMHPYLQQPDLWAYLKDNDIRIEGFASLTPLKEPSPDALGEMCSQLANKYGVSESAVLLRWVIDQGAAVVTTSAKRERLDEYMAHIPTFRLTLAEVEQISMSSGTKRQRMFFAEEFEQLPKS